MNSLWLLQPLLGQEGPGGGMWMPVLYFPWTTNPWPVDPTLQVLCYGQQMPDATVTKTDKVLALTRLSPS